VFKLKFWKRKRVDFFLEFERKFPPHSLRLRFLPMPSSEGRILLSYQKHQMVPKESLRDSLGTSKNGSEKIILING
jgi:hypothetical protein